MFATKQPWIWEGIHINCSTCVFWKQNQILTQELSRIGIPAWEGLGSCQRNPPKVIDREVTCAYPETIGTDACGEQKLTEEDLHRAVKSETDKRFKERP